MAFLGIDLGTSACKVLVLSADGDIRASHTAGYGLEQPRPGWTQQNPADWVAAMEQALAAVLSVVPGGEIRGIGLSGQMHGFTPLDRAGEVLRPAILWNDQRTAAEALEIESLAGGTEALGHLTNNRMLTGYTGSKILWMQRHEPQLFERLDKALNPKDYLRLVLTGDYATEVSDASGTGLFDVRRRQWSAELLAKLPFDTRILPDCYESTVVSGQVSVQAAARFGLPAGIPVIGGGGDSVIQTLGSGVARPGVLQTTLGTAGIAAMALDTPADNPDGRLQVFCNVVPELWHCMGVSLNAGGALSWWRQTGNQDFAQLVAEAESLPPGAQGLLFLPYLNGERCPWPDPQARGGFIGLAARHERRHMTRAVMEGVAFALFDMFALMERMGLTSDLIKTSGGGARAQLWRQIQADLFGVPVVTTAGAAEGGALAAALLAGVSLGGWANVTEAAESCAELTRDCPDPGRGVHYRTAYGVYRALYETLRPTFAALSALEEDTLS